MKDYIVAVDDKNIRAYDTKAKNVMRILDDAERMQEIGRLIQRISDDWPCVIDIERHYKRYKGKVLPKDLSIVSQYQWEDYVNNEPSVCSGGFPIGFDLADEYGNFKTWYGEEPPPQAIWDLWGQLAHDPMAHDPTKWNDNTDKLCRLLTALQTEYDVLKMSGTAPQQPEPFVMDNRLESDMAKAMFEEFEKEGFLKIVEGGHYKWMKSKLSFAYFVRKASDYLELTEWKRDWKNNNPRKNKKPYYCREPFEKLFGIDKTSSMGDPEKIMIEKINDIFSSL